MKRKEDVIRYCLTFAGAYEDYPFHDSNWTAMRCRGNQKTFAFIYQHNGKLCVNLKCDPIQADFWRSVYPSVIPAYHMNKTHWNTLFLDGSVPLFEVEEMIRHSYELVRPHIVQKTKKGGKNG